jgi:hypothetical protein
METHVKRKNYAVGGLVAASILLLRACPGSGCEPVRPAPPVTTPAPAPTTPRPPQPTTPTTTPHQMDCDSTATPVGALPPATPMFCHHLVAGVPATLTQGANSWVDEFNHGASMADLGPGYKQYNNQVEIRTAGHFRHNEHWMVDIQPDGGNGMAMMRPDRSFRFQNGKLVVEADVAAGIEDYGNHVWTELVVSTSPTPHPGPPPYPDVAYGYGQFRNAHTIGVRLQSSRFPITALFAPNGTRTWELPFNAPATRIDYGGSPDGNLANAWRSCDGNDPDLNCRDRFRWELSKDSLVLYVNGVKYLENTGFPAAAQLPAAFLNSDVYVYFVSAVHTDDRQTIRYHWDRIAINPG